MSEENKAIMNRFMEEVINRRNLAAADEIVAEDFVELDPLPGQEQGREGLKQVIAMLSAAFHDLWWTVEEQIAEGDKVVTVSYGAAPTKAISWAFLLPAAR